MDVDLTIGIIKHIHILICHLSKRLDIFLNELWQISGTAAKLGRSTAYHHFTILFAVDKEVLSSVLKTELTVSYTISVLFWGE